MDTITRSDVQALLNQHEYPCISLFMPTVQSGDTSQNSIRFKNNLVHIEDQLKEKDLRQGEIEQMLRPAWDLYQDKPFWQHQSQGFALYLSPDFFRYYRLPYPVKERIEINDRFIIRPVLPMINENSQFYILALSQDSNRVLEANRYEVHEVQVNNMPKNLDEAIQADRGHHQSDFEFRRAVGTGDLRAGSYHGQGEVKDEQRDLLMRYFRKIDAAFREFMGSRNDPLVLAGVEYLLSLYQEASDYPHIMKAKITGSPDEIKDKELRDRALNIVTPYFQKEKENAQEQYRQNAHTPRASDDPEAIIPAAYYGQVETLFVPITAQVCGTFNPQTGEVEWENQENHDHTSQDLLDLAAGYTLANKGRVFVLDPSQMPAASQLVAIFRYALK